MQASMKTMKWSGTYLKLNCQKYCSSDYNKHVITFIHILWGHTAIHLGSVDAKKSINQAWRVFSSIMLKPFQKINWLLPILLTFTVESSDTHNLLTVNERKNITLSEPKNINGTQKMMSFYLCYTWQNEWPLYQPNTESHTKAVQTYQNLYRDMQTPADETGSYEEAQLSCGGYHFLWSFHCIDWWDIVKRHTTTVRNCFKQISITHTQKFHIINTFLPPFLYLKPVWYP